MMSKLLCGLVLLTGVALAGGCNMGGKPAEPAAGKCACGADVGMCADCKAPATAEGKCSKCSKDLKCCPACAAKGAAGKAALHKCPACSAAMDNCPACKGPLAKDSNLCPKCNKEVTNCGHCAKAPAPATPAAK